MSYAHKVYVVLCRAAEEGAPCPSNHEISAEVRCRSAAAVEAIESLIAEDLIKVERIKPGSPYRRIIIIGTGNATDWSLRRGIPRARDIKRGVISLPIAPEVQAEPIRVNRDPCPFCAVRSDIGCVHSQRWAA